MAAAAPEGVRSAEETVDTVSLAMWIASRITNAMSHEGMAMALAWRIYEITGRAFAVGLLGLSGFIPIAIFSVIGGVASDRFDRKRLCLGAQICTVAISGVLLLSSIAGSRSTLLIYALAAVLGAVRGIASPANAALFPLIVPERWFERTVPLHQTAFHGGRVLGPIIIGTLYARMGVVSVYVALTLIIAASTMCLALTRPRPGAHSTEPFNLQMVVGGMRYVRDHRVLLGALALDFFAVILAGEVALLPAFAKDVLHGGPDTLAWLRAGPSIGAAIGGLYLGLRPIGRSMGRWMLGSVALYALAIYGFASARTLASAVVFLVFAGAFDMVSVVVRTTLVQLRTPNEVRGRVSAVSQVFVAGSNELGEFESGIVAEAIGLIPALRFGAVAALGVVGVVAWRVPELRRAD